MRHQRGLSENESFHSIKALWPGLTRDQFADALARVRNCLSGRKLWGLLARHPHLQSLSPVSPGADPAASEAGLVDPRPDPSARRSCTSASPLSKTPLNTFRPVRAFWSGSATGRSCALRRLRG